MPRPPNRTAYNNITTFTTDEFSLSLAPQRDSKHVLPLFSRINRRWRNPPSNDRLFPKRLVEVSSAAADTSTAVREDIPSSLFGEEDGNKTRAFMVHNALSRAECSYVIDKTAPLMESTRALFAQRHRVSDRAMVRSDDVADELYRRLLPHLVHEDFAGRIPLCFGHGGVWHPHRLNNCLKIVSYERNAGHFAAHRDGPWIPREDEASMFTVLVYLNDNQQGGETGLIGSALTGHVGRRECDNGGASVFVLPLAGTMLLFNHDCWHIGLPSLHNAKFILRTELIFRRSHGAYVDRCVYRRGEDYADTRRLYASSMALLDRGEKDGFFTMYQDVIQAQFDAMCTTMDEIGPHRQCLRNLPREVLTRVFRFISLADVLAFMLVNRSTYYHVVQLPLWQHLCQERFPAAVAAVHAKVLCRGAPLGAFHCNTAVPFIPIDWMTAFAQLKLAAMGAFVPAVVAMSHHGCVLAFPKIHSELPPERYYTPQNRREHRSVFGCRADVSFLTLPNLYQEIDNPLHMNRPRGESQQAFGYSVFRQAETHVKVHHIVDPTMTCVDWSVLSVEIEKAVNPTWMPFLIVGLPHWFVDSPGAARERRLLEESFLEQLRAPAVLIIHPAALVLAIDVGPDETFLDVLHAALIDGDTTGATVTPVDGETGILFVESLFHVDGSTPQVRIYGCSAPAHGCPSPTTTLLFDSCKNSITTVEAVEAVMETLLKNRSFQYRSIVIDWMPCGEDLKLRMTDPRRDADAALLMGLIASECVAHALSYTPSFYTPQDLTRSALQLANSPMYRQLCTFRFE